MFRLSIVFLLVVVLPASGFAADLFKVMVSSHEDAQCLTSSGAEGLAWLPDGYRVLSDMVREQDVEAFVRKMKAAAAHFGDTASALRRSDKLINSKINEFDELVRSIGKECGLVHMYSGVTHVGTIEKVTPREIILLSGSRSISLKIENVSMLSENNLREWKGVL